MFAADFSRLRASDLARLTTSCLVVSRKELSGDARGMDQPKNKQTAFVSIKLWDGLVCEVDALGRCFMQPSNPAFRPSLELLHPAPLRCGEENGHS
jgi:hypothetical protein